MIQSIYASAATKPFSPKDLDVLLSKARARNSVYQVSGMLLYHEGSFLQVLEGPEASVDLILASIFRDPAHYQPRTLLRQTIMHREFEGWSMGFADPSQFASHPSGYVDYTRELVKLPDAGTRAHQYLRFFREGLYRQKVS